MVTWILMLMTALRLTEPGPEVDWSSTYEDTANGIAAAAHADPLPGGEEFTGALLTVQAWQESRFKPTEVHDHGAGHGEWGVHLETSRDIEGCKTVEDLEDPARGAVCALRLMHTSFRICKQHPVVERLAWFAFGSSGCEHRLDLSRYRVGLAKKLIADHPLSQSLTSR